MGFGNAIGTGGGEENEQLTGTEGGEAIEAATGTDGGDAIEGTVSTVNSMESSSAGGIRGRARDAGRRKGGKS